MISLRIFALILGIFLTIPSSRLSPSAEKTFVFSAALDEFVGPFASWKNLKLDYGAVGDGIADDTTPLQRALDDMGTPSSPSPHLWIPNGTYRITKTLRRKGVSGLQISGEDPDRTILKWDGPKYAGQRHSYGDAAWDGVEPSDMLWLNGSYCKIERVTFDGEGKAASGIAYKWNSDKPEAGQIPSHRSFFADVVFKNVAMGFDGGGKMLSLDSEVFLNRCRFLRCFEYGVGLHTFNSVNYWIWRSRFENCRIAVSNEPPPYGGVVHVYDSVFIGSTEADFTIFHTSFFALRDNVSVGSRRFFHAKNNGGNGALVTLQGNVVLDPLESDAICQETIGDLNMTDNAIRSRTTAKSPVVRSEIDQGANGAGVHSYIPVSLSAIGNAFTLPNPILVRGSGYKLDNTVIAPSTILASVPDFIPAPLVQEPMTIEIPTGADGTVLQAAIDRAADYASRNPGAQPILHLPRGTYPVTKTLVVPVKVPIRIVGDGAYEWPDGLKGTILQWASDGDPGPVMKLLGPSRATLQDFAISATPPWKRAKNPTPDPNRLTHPPATDLTASLVAEDADQRNGRVWLEGCDLGALGGTGLLVDQLDRTLVAAMAHQGEGLDQWNDAWKIPADDLNVPYPAIRVIGGPSARSGAAVPGVIVQGANCGRFDARNGGRLLARDFWYESSWAPFHMILSGDADVTLESANEAISEKTSPAAYLLKNFHGKLTLLHVSGSFNPKNPMLAFSGDCSGGRVLALGDCGRTGFLTGARKSAGARLTLINNREDPTILSNSSVADSDFIRSMLASARRKFEPLETDPPAASTDLRLIRIWTGNAHVGVVLKAGSASRNSAILKKGAPSNAGRER